MLRPRGAGELLDAAISLYRRNWRTFMAIAALVIVPFTVLQQYAVSTAVEPFRDIRSVQDLQAAHEASLRIFILSLALAAVGFLLVYPLITAALVRAVADSYLGERISVGRAYAAALRRLAPLLGAIVLQLLGVVAVFVPVVVVAIATGSAAVAVPLGMGALVVAMLVYARLLFAASAVVIEAAGPVRALVRSWELSLRSAWRILGVVLLAALLAGIVNIILVLPVNFVEGVRTGEAWVLPAIATSVAQVITNPFVTMMPVLLYFDLRIRKEGFDLAMMARELSRPTP